MVSDNDPAFVSSEMREFYRQNGILLKNSPPFHPASNGQVERYVGTLKQALKKLQFEGGEIHTNLSRFLFRQRMMTSSTGETPARRMIGRELRSKLDLSKEASVREDCDDQNCRFKLGDAVMARDFHERRLTSGNQEWWSSRTVHERV